jgi:hypothetical protein
MVGCDPARVALISLARTAFPLNISQTRLRELLGATENDIRKSCLLVCLLFVLYIICIAYNDIILLLFFGIGIQEFSSFLLTRELHPCFRFFVVIYIFKNH